MIVDSPQSAVAVVENSASFDCSARGKPTPVITWWRRGVMLMDGDKFRITSSSVEGDNYFISSQLNISSIALEDDDDYVCIATNIVGRSMVTASLEVQGLWYT